MLSCGIYNLCMTGTQYIYVHTGRYPRGIDANENLNILCPRRDFIEVGYKFGGHLFLTFNQYMYKLLMLLSDFFPRFRVDTDSNKAKIRKNLKHKYV